MDDKPGDPFDPAPRRPRATGEASTSRTAEFELQLRSTERVRTVIRRSCQPHAAPQRLVLKIRESLVVLKG